MNFRKHALAFSSAIVIVGASLSTGDAFAYGPQWRPTPGFAPAHNRAFPRVANVPAFRPPVASHNRPTSWPDQRRLQPQIRSPYPGWSQPQPQMAYGYGVPPIGLPAPHRFAGALVPPAPAWGVPPAAWHPAWGSHAQPRLPARPVGYPGAVDPRMAAHYPLPASQGFGGWRPLPGPAAPPAAARVSWPVAQAPAPYPVYRLNQPPAWPAVTARFDAAGPSPRYAAPRWRPDPGALAPAWRSDRGFRPLAHGRSAFGGERVTADLRGAPEATRQGLPGWVTTLPDSGGWASCDWCGDS